MVFIVSYQYSVVSIQTLRVQNYRKKMNYASKNMKNEDLFIKCRMKICVLGIFFVNLQSKRKIQ